ncbi:pyruvate dehydrogenase kinase isozyme 1,mitochondrial [Wickerhamomyces ciferrii]|uniref:Protein-serine/threonine kinase n=1 Tax=Wickerhamomyces ciferrii (strain ATCC 14091 / BCRC 22168 / CBS 111 / JCM 3599 / NBRC 0793 / NRRL Y-1031 F-60-10) TaxID=1206466 RepID=K0KNE9_WICCF|nr:pyruvate dehydrogenase kinase isozyme 1,mitochondrial [Wickerhamomyces ciferrii]CCH42653.1 pyruvate dehydrogenase kinase isozyme 1,mitochondrial [Wickerhamomyces ciferrii]
MIRARIPIKLNNLQSTKQCFSTKNPISSAQDLKTEEINITTPPNFNQYHENIHSIASHLSDLGPYPQHSQYLNPQHYYQNTVLMNWAQRTPHPVTLRQLAAFGKALNEEKIISSANFVRLELPIRIALILRDLQDLPFNVVNNFHLAKVYESYYDIFDRFRKIPQIKTIQDNNEFCKTLENVLTDINLLNLPNLMMGALECRILDAMPPNQLDELVSSLLRARISRRLILEEHLSLTKNFNSNPNSPRSHIGDIFFKCSAKEHLQISATNAAQFISSIYPNVKSPKLIIEGEKQLSFQFLTSHLHYLFGEILRNSYEATVKQFLKTSSHPELETPPPIKVTIIENKDHVAFRFSDQGGGIDIKPINKIWSFGKSSNAARESLANFHKLPNLELETHYSKPLNVNKRRQSLMQTSIGGIDNNIIKETTLIDLIQRPASYKLGLGLAMCKTYADYWNGDLVMHSLNGFGTDTYLKLGKLSHASDKSQLHRA